MAIRIAGDEKMRRNATILIQRVYRGNRGRSRANFEREKYLFSRSQNRGIEIGRQMLAEHKIEATRLQSELCILEKEKASLEEKVKRILEEIQKFQNKVTSLESIMQELSMAELELKSSMYTSAKAAADISLREQKV